MEHLWEHDAPATVRDVVEALASRQLAYTTVMTVLDRLWSKGFVSRRRRGRAYLYRPKVTREQYTGRLVEQVLAGARDRRSVLLGFLRESDPSELAELRSLIREVERERTRRS